jgi:hypothetical protein
MKEVISFICLILIYLGAIFGFVHDLLPTELSITLITGASYFSYVNFSILKVY